MRKFLLGVLAGLLLAGLTIVVLGFALVRFGGPTAPVVESGSVLMLRLEGPIAETAQPEMPFPFPFAGQTSPVTVHELWTSIRAAATDSRVKAIALTPRAIAAGWGKLDEIRSALKDFRKSGKPVIAWLRTPGLREYYLSTAADKIYIAEEDVLNVKGLRAELTFLKGSLDKVGVQMEVEHIGKYKDAGDPFSRTSATPETREVINSILDGVYGSFIAATAEARKKSAEEIKALIDDGPYLADKALKAGLIDGLMYEDQFVNELKKRSGESELKKLSVRTYARDAMSSQRGARVALITGEGAILRGSSSGFADDEMIMSEDFIKLLRQAANDESLRGAIVRIDSPGGDAIASDDILREMKLLSQKKPIVISMSDVAASGGYFIASTSDPIVAYPNTITGSIGVVFSKPNVKGLYDKLGLTRETFTRGRNAAIDSLYGPMTDTARAKLREGIQATYDGFVKRVADARRTTPAAIEPYAQGRAWLGSQSRERKLVDDLGGFDKAIDLLRSKAKIASDERVRLIPYPPRRSLLAKYFSQTPETVAEAQIRRWMKENGLGPAATALLQGGMMRMMPYALELK